MPKTSNKPTFDLEAASLHYAMGANAQSATLMGILTAEVASVSSVTVRGSCFEAMATLCAALPRLRPDDYSQRFANFKFPEARIDEVTRALGPHGTVH